MKRTLVLWAVLIGLFFLFYFLFSRPPPLPGEEPTALQALVASPVKFMGAMGVVFFALFAFFLSRNVRTVRLHNEGLVLSQQGRLVDALAKFQAARDGSRIPQPSLGIGLTQLALWRIPEAIAALEDFQRRVAGTFFSRAPGMDPLVRANLALARALQGDTEAAAALVKQAAPGAEASATTTLAELVLACRAETWPAARDLLSRHALQLDQLGGGFRALSDALTAWVASKTGGADGAVSSVRLFRESSPDALKQSWPQFVEFVQRVEAGPQQGLP